MLRSVAAFGALAICQMSTSVGIACDRVPFSEVRFAGLTYFIAVPLAEIIDAGPNSPSSQEPLQLHGQVVRLERIGGAGADAALRGARAARNRLLLVPWDDAPDCTRLAWGASHHPYWDAGKRGFFVAALRAEKEWVRAIPTLDVHPAFMEPYPYAEFFREGYRGTKLAGPSDLSVDQYWTLYEALPEYDDLKSDPLNALRAIRRWKEMHPNWAAKYPAASILSLIPWSLGNTPGPLPPEKVRPILPEEDR